MMMQASHMYHPYVADCKQDVLFIELMAVGLVIRSLSNEVCHKVKGAVLWN